MKQVFAILLLLFSSNVYSQNKVIKGTPTYAEIKSPNGERIDFDEATPAGVHFVSGNGFKLKNVLLTNDLNSCLFSLYSFDSLTPIQTSVSITGGKERQDGYFLKSPMIFRLKTYIVVIADGINLPNETKLTDRNSKEAQRVLMYSTFDLKFNPISSWKVIEEIPKYGSNMIQRAFPSKDSSGLTMLLYSDAKPMISSGYCVQFKSPTQKPDIVELGFNDIIPSESRSYLSYFSDKSVSFIFEQSIKKDSKNKSKLKSSKDMNYFFYSYDFIKGEEIETELEMPIDSIDRWVQQGDKFIAFKIKFDSKGKSQILRASVSCINGEVNEESPILFTKTLNNSISEALSMAPGVKAKGSYRFSYVGTPRVLKDDENGFYFIFPTYAVFRVVTEKEKVRIIEDLKYESDKVIVYVDKNGKMEGVATIPFQITDKIGASHELSLFVSNGKLIAACGFQIERKKNTDKVIKDPVIYLIDSKGNIRKESPLGKLFSKTNQDKVEYYFYQDRLIYCFFKRKSAEVSTVRLNLN